MIRRRIPLVVGILLAWIVLILVVPWLNRAFSTYVLHTQHGNGYQWTSGPEARITYITLITLVVGAFKHWNCDAPFCFRHGPFPTADGQHHLCHVHHPDHPTNRKHTLEEILEIHEAAKEEAAKQTKEA